MRILGIDPGSVICGWAVIDSRKTKLTTVDYGVLNFRNSKEDIYLRIAHIFRKVTDLVNRTKIDAAVFETIFYSKNIQSLIKLTHSRAAAIVAASHHYVPIFEYSPREIKQSVTGNGNASKEQVQFMVKTILNLEEKPKFFDASDALAIAICHSMRSSNPHLTAGNWKDFIEKNPDRIVTY